MSRILLLLFIDCLLTQLVFTQYNDGYNRGYNQLKREGREDDRQTYNTDEQSRGRPTTDAYDQPNERNDRNEANSRQTSYSSEYKEETPMPYQFEYNIDDGFGNKQDRHERADEFGNVVGSYGYLDSNGIYRKVHYTAGPEGFVAKVNSNEPFLKDGANPAHVMLFVEDPPNNISPNDGRQSDFRGELNDNFEGNERQNRDQIYRAANNRVRSAEKRYDTNNGQDFGRMRPLLQMLRPQLDRNRDLQQPIDTFKSHKNRYNQDIEAYASNRRYFD